MLVGYVTIPQCDNNGISLAEEAAQLQAEVLARFGGLSIYPGIVGFWLDNTKVYKDISQVWEVANTSGYYTNEQFRMNFLHFAESVKIHCRQLAVYVKFVEADVTVI